MSAIKQDFKRKLVEALDLEQVEMDGMLPLLIVVCWFMAVSFVLSVKCAENEVRSECDYLDCTMGCCCVTKVCGIYLI